MCCNLVEPLSGQQYCWTSNGIDGLKPIPSQLWYTGGRTKAGGSLFIQAFLNVGMLKR